MNLLEYIKERRLLDQLNTIGIHKNYNNIKKLLEETTVEHRQLTIDGFGQQLINLEDELAKIYKLLEAQFLKEVQPSRLVQSYNNYENKKIMDLEVVSDSIYTKELKLRVMSKIKKYVDFQFPGCEIGPRSAYWTKELGGMDPLFLVGPDLKIIEEIITENFNPIYQRRLRIYQIEDTDFSYLPQKAFAFVFSWYHFEFLPYDIIDKYLAGIFNMLRPGGVAFLSYANCLMEKSAEQFENSYYCYMTTELIEGLANKNGFDVMEQEDFQSRMSWVILKRPGRKENGIKVVPSMGYVKAHSNEPIP